MGLQKTQINSLHFNPLPPCGGRLPNSRQRQGCQLFQSTPSVWRETCKPLVPSDALNISIHSLRVEGDTVQQRPHALPRFQSTPSVWRETAEQAAHNEQAAISIHSLRVEGDCR